MLYDQIKNSLKEAMMAKDTVKLETMRAIVAGFTIYLTSKNRRNTPDKLEISKYCRYCNKHTVHKETK